MSMRSAAVKSLDSIAWDASEYECRTAVYGGLVGEMLTDLEARINAPYAAPAISEEPADFIHRISVACGYICFIMGLSAAALLIYHYFG